MTGRGSWRSWLGTALTVACAAAASAQDLEVASSGPTGEVAQLEEAREVRVVFSEPMVTLGRIPADVRPPFFKISPAVPGGFRWSGTRTLIFTPSDPQRLPHATRYDVTVDTTATSVAGRRLATPHTFSFTTPTVRLLRTNWYRQSRRYDSPLVVLLRFNQPVTHAGLAPHLELRYQPHDFTPPVLPPEARARLSAVDPRAAADFEAKVARAQAAAASTAPVPVSPAASWDQTAFPPASDLLVWVTGVVPPPDAWIQVRVGPGARGVQGDQTPGKAQEFTLKLDPTFFVDGFRCREGCDPDQYNPLRLRTAVGVRALGGALQVRDVSDPTRPAPVSRRKAAVAPETAEAEAPAVGDGEEDGVELLDRSSAVTLEDAGFPLRPARAYEVTVARTARASDGQTLGYTWIGHVEHWHQRGFTSFGSGHGVWESAGGGQLPFQARNLTAVTQWLRPLRVEELMPALRRLEDRAFRLAPEGAGTPRPLRLRPDRLQSLGLDLTAALSPGGTGLLWAALQDGPTLARARPASDGTEPRSTLVQVTNLGLSLKDSPHRTLVFVTRLDTAAPVAGARVAIRDLDNQVRWSGTTDAQGVATAANLSLRKPDEWWRLSFLVTAEKDGDVAYLGSNWHEGLEAWMFGLSYDLDEAGPLLRGTVFADRGVYRLGEEVHLKAILRADTPEGIRPLPGASAEVVLRDSQGQELDKRTLPLGEWSSADWTVRLPADGALGYYEVQATVAGHPRPVTGSFLVAAYRRPEFRVDPQLTGASSLAGVALKGTVEARYLFGAPMTGQPVRWTFSRAPLYSVTPAVADRFPEERWSFLDQDWTAEHRPEEGTLQTAEATLDPQGRLPLDLATAADAGVPYQYTLEGEVTDVSRQTLAGRSSFRVDPAPWYLGLKRPGYFNEAARGLDTEVVAAGLDGTAVAGVPITVTLTQVQWHGVRRAEGGGFYSWETERREVPAGRWEVASAATPVPLHVDLPGGGYFVLQATARDAEGRTTRTALSFYALGAGYTAWERYDHNRVDLVPEKKTYRPGDQARILVKSPWETATALVTTEREGVRSHRTFTLDSTQQTITVPLAESDIPNVYVSVLLVKGRTAPYDATDTGDPGKPSFRLGYAQLMVEDATRRLTVAVTADREEYRPGQKARVEVAVSDHQARPASAEVTLWAVDYGVLSLTGYRTPDVLGSVYVAKALQVMNTDSRQRIISRRAIVPKGGEEGGGGGADAGPGTPVRKDFRVLAFWLGSLATDARGRAATEVVLPEGLTTYRIMAVAGDRESRFGQGDREVRVSKPVLLRAAFPRFLARGDTATFGAVVTSQLPGAGKAEVTVRSLDPRLLEVTGPARQTVPMAAHGTAEVRFPVAARAVGDARVQMTVRLLGQSDAFEETLPVRVLVSPEVVAAYGQARPDAREALSVPARVVPGYGGLQVDLASTALVGLGEGARYLVSYPYGCAEQRASAALALMLAADLGDAFSLPGIAPAALNDVVRTTLAELPGYQCPSGGFAFWKGACSSVSPYLTSYVLHVYQRAARLGHPVNADVLGRGYEYLEGELRAEKLPDEGWWPAHTAWQAFAIRVLAQGGRNVDTPLNRVWPWLDRMPVFALAYLRDALQARAETGARPDELDRRLRNAILPEGGTAHVRELSDPHLLWFWNSNVRSTAVTLGTLVRTGGDAALAAQMARWLLAARKQGRWDNTQENATAMEALVDYYRRFEGEVPDFTAVVKLGRETLVTETFRGRSTEGRTRTVPMDRLAARGSGGEDLALSLAREGTGTLHYVARLRYAPDEAAATPLDQGFAVGRSYAAEGAADPATSFQAGQLVTVTLTFDVPKERRYVAVTDPLPAGLEPVESWFATTATDLAAGPDAKTGEEGEGGAPEELDWTEWWDRGGFDRVERHDDRVLLFATRLSEGRHVFSYLARATTAGRFQVSPARAEEMYEPEVFGRTSSAVVEVHP